jgi:hypothetical protein
VSWTASPSGSTSWRRAHRRRAAGGGRSMAW